MGKGNSKIEGSYIKCDKGDTKPSDTLKTIPDCLKFRAEMIPDEDGVVFYSPDEPRLAVTWKELYTQSCKMAKFYIKLGITSREPIAVVCRNSPEWLYVTFGAMLAGIPVAGVYPEYKDGSDLIATMKQMKTCSLLVLDPGFSQTYWEIVKQLLDTYSPDGKASSSQMPCLKHLLFTEAPTDENVKTITGLLADTDDAIELPDIDPNETAILFTTSGSIGLPKLVAMTHAALLRAREMVLGCGIFGNNPHFNDHPFGWVGGFPAGFMYGNVNVTRSGKSPLPTDRVGFLINVIKSEGCKDVSMVPPLIHELAKREKDLPADWPLETIWTGGQPMSKSITSCIGKVCKRLLIVYAGTEMSIGACTLIENPDDFEEYASGLPPPGVELKIVDSDGKLVPAGERGEIYVRHEWLFKEYYNDPERTAAVKTEDGWCKTNDCGMVHPRGFLIAEGRVSDVIICDSINVAPALTEIVLNKHPTVESAIIVPVPDAVMHQTICACVTLKSGLDVTEADLHDYMKKLHTEQHYLISVLPKYYMILDKFPVGKTGKVSKMKLREMAEQKFKC